MDSFITIPQPERPDHELWKLRDGGKWIADFRGYDELSPPLLDRYPATFDKNPLTGKSKKPPYPSATFGNTVTGWMRNKGEPRECASCPGLDPLNNVVEVLDHLLEKHGIKALNNQRYWTAEGIRGPGLYYTSTGMHYADPLDKLVASQQFLEDRGIMTVNSSPFGVEPSIAVPDVTLDEDKTGMPHDTTYLPMFVRSIPVRDGLCNVCTNDPTATLEIRGRPHNQGTQALGQHVAGGCVTHFDFRVGQQQHL